MQFYVGPIFIIIHRLSCDKTTYILSYLITCSNGISACSEIAVNLTFILLLTYINEIKDALLTCTDSSVDI